MTTSTKKPRRSSSGTQPEAVPRYATPRRPERPTFGPQIADVAADLGRPLMPWQADFADVLGEYDPATGIPYYSTAFYTVPRRSGKTLLMLSWVMRRMLMRKYQIVPWSAQSRSDARELWLDELYPMLRTSRLRKTIAKLGEGNGSEHIKLKNGSVCRLVAPGEKTGHGKGTHGSAEDEIFADDTDWRNQAFGPGMLTVPDSQTLKTSAAGTARSTVYNAYRKEGREAVKAGKDTGICYLEYSADDDWDHLDTESYWRHMPALGYTITPGKIRTAIDDMLRNPKQGVAGVRRAYGNIPDNAGTGSVLPADKWEAICSSVTQPEVAGCVLGVAVSEDRSSSSVAVADPSGRVELIRNAPGTEWFIEQARKSHGEFRAKVVLHATGPASADIDRLPAVQAINSTDYARACGAFYDAVINGDGIEVRTHPLLDASVEGVVMQKTSDRFVWSRKASTEDVTPIEAVTLAWAAARGHVDPLSQIG